MTHQIINSVLTAHFMTAKLTYARIQISLSSISIVLLKALGKCLRRRWFASPYCPWQRRVQSVEKERVKLLEHTATIDDDFWTSSRSGASLRFARSSIMHQLQQLTRHQRRRRMSRSCRPARRLRIVHVTQVIRRRRNVMWHVGISRSFQVWCRLVAHQWILLFFNKYHTKI